MINYISFPMRSVLIFYYANELYSITVVISDKTYNSTRKIQWQFAKHVTGMHDIPYHKWLKSIKLYSL